MELDPKKPLWLTDKTKKLFIPMSFLSTTLVLIVCLLVVATVLLARHFFRTDRAPIAVSVIVLGLMFLSSGLFMFTTIKVANDQPHALHEMSATKKAATSAPTTTGTEKQLKPLGIELVPVNGIDNTNGYVPASDNVQ